MVSDGMDAVEEVKNRLAIEDVVGEYVQLKRAGRNFKGLSPFNAEKTPSFIVSPEKQIWHDFSSGKGGNIFSFIMEMEGLEFKGALELLARKAGFDLEQTRGHGSSNSELKERLFQANELAARFYQKQFTTNKSAADYVLKTRGFTRQITLDFRLGYAPDTGDALNIFLTKKGFNKQELEKAGLVTRGSYSKDMFRKRLMVPLADAQGRIIGFTGRLLGDEDNQPKYLNTPATLIYDKSRHVFGLHLAKDAIRRAKFGVVVEGNLDVIASHQIGVNNVVATAGTAVTLDHLKTISRFAPDVRLSFDTDKAGIDATERAIPLASKVGATLSIIVLKNAKDPDELIKKDPNAWKKAVDKPKYAMDWLIEHYEKSTDLSSGAGKRQFSDVLLPTLKNLQDPVEQDHYLTKIARIMNVSPAALKEKLDEKKDSASLRRKKVQAQVEHQAENLEWAKAQDHFFALILMRPSLRDLIDLLDTAMLPQASAVRLLEYLQAHPNFDGNLSKAPLLQSITDYVKILSLQYEALFVSLDEVDGRYEAMRLRARLISIFVKNRKTELSKNLESTNDEETRKILARVKALDNLLKASQETITL